MDRQLASRRLLRDLKQVLQHPLPGIVALPCDDIFIWHGNVKCEALASVPIHFTLLFAGGFPATAPEVRLYHAMPHPNVMAAPERNRAPKSNFRLALWDCVPSFDGWSCAYTVPSILMQIQAFLLDDEMQFADRGKTSAAEITRRAMDLDLTETCGHTGEEPWPAFHPEHIIRDAPKWRLKAISRAPVLASYNVPAYVTGAPPAAKAATQAPDQAAASTAVLAAAPWSSNTPANPPSPAAGASLHSTPGKPASEGVALTVPIAPPSSDAAACAGEPAKGDAPAPVPEAPWTSVAGKWQHKLPASKKIHMAGTGAVLAGVYACAASAAVSNANPFQALHHLKHHSLDAAHQAAILTKTPPSAPVELNLQPVSSSKEVIQAGHGKKKSGKGQPIKATPSGKQKPTASAPKAAPPPAQPDTQPVEGLWEQGPGALKGGAHGKPLSASALKRYKKLLRKAAASCSDSACNASVCDSAMAVEQPADVSTAEGMSDAADEADGAATGKGSVADADAAAAPAKDSDAEPPTDLFEQLDLQQPHHELIAAVQAAVDAERQTALLHASPRVLLVGSVCAQGPAPEGAHHDAQRAMAGFGWLGQDVLAVIMGRLAPRDVAALGATCRGLRASARDGLVWKGHLQRSDPHSTLPPTAFGSWRQAFLLEANHAAEQIRCCVSHAGPAHAVLGLPIRWTTNPLTKKVDYIEASPELMSTAAFQAGIRKGVTNEAVHAVLPVYIDREHFQRALPELNTLARTLAPELCQGGQSPPPTAWLDIVPRVMNTAIVLLATEGASNSDAATSIFCHLHRLVLALAEHYSLWGAAAARVRTFLADPDARVKSACPNIGWLLPLLALTPRFPLRTLLPAVLDESFDRSILWLCKHEHSGDPAAMPAALQRASPACDPQLVELSMQSSKTGNRLLLFHAAFLQLVAHPAGKDLAGVMHGYDALLGIPSVRVFDRMRAAVRAILAVDSYAALYKLLGIQYRGDEWLTGKLRTAWKRSLAKGYHKKNMDFSKVHKSGVSRILLKGNQYSAPPNLERVEVTDHWRWRDNVVYLDASCIAVKVDQTSGSVHRVVRGYADYNHERSRFTREEGAITHSGDILDYDSRTGKHTMTIRLGALGLDIDELYFTASTFAGAKLADVQQPYITIVDPASGMELCGCTPMEDVSEGQRARNSAIVMCKLYRGNGRWHVQSIGSVGKGSACDMDSLFNTIHPGMKSSGRQQL